MTDGPVEAPSLPSTSGTSVHRLTVYGNISASGSRRSDVSSSLLGKGYLPSLVPLHCWLLSGNLVGPLLLTPSKKGGGGPKVPRETPEP